LRDAGASARNASRGANKFQRARASPRRALRGPSGLGSAIVTSAAPCAPDILEQSMRLTSDEIEFLARKIIKTLVAEGKLEVDSEPRVVGDIIKVITEDMSVEDRLNEEVRAVLMQHAAEMERSNMSYTDMFKMLKKKMAKEKGIVL
jgi:polyhydroxyalkanoate synthesis regulator phasin